MRNHRGTCSQCSIWKTSAHMFNDSKKSRGRKNSFEKNSIEACAEGSLFSHRSLCVFFDIFRRFVFYAFQLFLARVNLKGQQHMVRLRCMNIDGYKKLSRENKHFFDMSKRSVTMKLFEIRIFQRMYKQGVKKCCSLL